MRCAWVEQRLVAWRDDELSPGEATFVMEHVDRCPACAALDARLQDATPDPWLAPPPDVLARMHAALDAAIERESNAEATRPAPRSVVNASRIGRWARWLRRDRDLSNASAIGYVALLAACFGWGLSNWMAIETSAPGSMPEAAQASVSAPTDPRDMDPAASGAAIPAEQYRPASWSPRDEAEDWR